MSLVIALNILVLNGDVLGYIPSQIFDLGHYARQCSLSLSQTSTILPTPLPRLCLICLSSRV